MGATPGSVISLVLRQSAAMIVTGVAIGAVAAWGAGLVLANVVAGARPLDAVTALVMTSVLVAAAALASLVPAGRASRVDVLDALRQD